MPRRRRRWWKSPSLDWLLIFIPISVAARFLNQQPVVVFILSALAILPLAGLIGRATEQVAAHSGQRLGGLFNATFGNVTELIISIFLLAAGEIDVVKVSLIGSVLGNLLLVMGTSFLVGGWGREEQSFSPHAASVHNVSLLLGVLGLVMPTMFALTATQDSQAQRSIVSAVVAVLLIALYGGALLFMLVTHTRLFPVLESGTAEWSLQRALIVLGVAAGLVGVESEILVGSLEQAAQALSISPLFIGLVIVPIVGNAAEHASAVFFAAKDQLDATLEIATGSSTQIALLLAPLLVFISLLFAHPMDLVFSPIELIALALAVIIGTVVARDGRSNWLEGAQLLAAWGIVAAAFFFLERAPAAH